jgi:hypothetical protein
MGGREASKKIVLLGRTLRGGGCRVGAWKRVWSFKVGKLAQPSLSGPKGLPFGGAARTLPASTPGPPGQGRCTQSKAANLLDLLEDIDWSILAFLRDARVPFTNNQAEQDIRMIKVHQKISSFFAP